jgi:hypothetical protein
VDAGEGGELLCAKILILFRIITVDREVPFFCEVAGVGIVTRLRDE